MLDPKTLDNLARRLSEAMPQGLQGLGMDVEKNLRAVIEGVLGRMNLVTREEFEAQKQVLTRCRATLETLEQRIAELESTLESTQDKS